MNGPDHFTEAERLIWSTNRWDGDIPENEGDLDQLSFYTLQRAQVHATLALAAATVWANLPYTLKAPNGAELWREVTS